MGRKKSIFVLSLVFVAGIAFTGLFHTGLDATNELEFCTSCHSMQWVYEEYKDSVHYKNAAGIQADCADCHVPKPFLPKMKRKILAYKDVLHEILGTIDTKEKFEEYRWKMANAVWDRMRSQDSMTCKSCHQFSQMDLSSQSRTARSRHSSAVDKGETCIDCHKGIAHIEPFPPLDL